MYSDGVSYLEIANFYAHGAWKNAVNEYWSPMFSWLLAAALYVIHPSAGIEAVLFHGVLFAGYLAALFAFEYFLRELIRVCDTLFPGRAPQPAFERALLVSAYSAFLWATSSLPGSCSPDVWVTALLYLASAVLLRSGRQKTSLALCAAFGALIGVGWLTKAALLPIGLATLPAFAISVRRWRKPVLPLLCTVAALGAVCFPFLAAIRVAKGHWTFGKSGLLNYSWEVNGVARYFHWQGGPAGVGTPLHPTRQISAWPPAYEFSTSLPVTYAPWFDPAYWYDGIRVRFDGGRQIRAFGINFSIVLLLLLLTPGILPAAVVWGLRKRKFPRFAGWWKMTSGVWVWCGVTIFLYSLVFVEPRYITGALAVMSCLLLAPVLSVPRSLGGGRVHWFTGASVLACLQVDWRPVFFGAAFLLFNLTGLEPYPNTPWKDAQYAESMGMRAGDPVAVIGSGFNLYWPHLVGARIVAEIPLPYEKRLDFAHSPYPVLTDIQAFWNATPERQHEIIDAFARVGARWVIAEPVPMGIKPSGGWIEIPFMRKGEKEFHGVTRAFVLRLGGQARDQAQAWTGTLPSNVFGQAERHLAP
jgi:hypothetical protein